MKKLLLTCAALMVAAPAMAEDMPAEAGMVVHPDARAEILGKDGTPIGQAIFQQGTVGVIASITIEKGALPPGKHGFHIHSVGTCEHMEHFTTASGHINPDEKKHGYLNPEGPDKGDLPNIIVHEDGSAALELFMPQVDVSGEGAALLDEDGSSLMIHENEDDHTTQPIGGAGARIACGVIKGNN